MCGGDLRPPAVCPLGRKRAGVDDLNCLGGGTFSPGCLLSLSAEDHISAEWLRDGLDVRQNLAGF